MCSFWWTHNKLLHAILYLIEGRGRGNAAKHFYRARKWMGSCWFDVKIEDRLKNIHRYDCCHQLHVHIFEYLIEISDKQFVRDRLLNGFFFDWNEERINLKMSFKCYCYSNNSICLVFFFRFASLRLFD